MNINIAKPTIIKSRTILGLALVMLFIGIGVFSVFHISKTSATDTANFNPGRIIDDSVFYNATTMSASDIQNFLNSKVPTCDTQGTQLTGSQTRAQYSATQGYYPPFTCLRDYSMTTSTVAPSAYCNGYSASNQTAAQIIYGVAQSCGINPQVLLVLLQKEQGLVTDTWPWSIQYRGATGYGCPDTAACDSSYYGLFNQLYSAARQFKLYAAKPLSYTFKSGQVNLISYSPAAGCGGTNINIQNQATAGLYNYTPYQPNAAALSQGNGTGSGDGCSAYGNMNFWLYFNQWFGTTTTPSVAGCSAATNTSLSCVWKLKKVSDGTEVLTSSYDTLANLLNSVGGYQYLGIAFYARNSTAPSTNNIPVYSLNAGSSVFLTTNYTEYQSMKTAGYKDNGIAFYADPVNSNSGYPVFRLYSQTLGHVWTTNQSQVQSYLANGFTNEGIAFTALSPVRQEAAPTAGKSLVYRFSIGNLEHFWTTDVAERDRMILSGYSYEGVAWNANQSATAKPIYRLYSTALRMHLFTSDLNEKNIEVAGGWNDEGIAFYQSASATSQPVYRLYSLANYEHLFSTDANERSVLVNSGVYKDEGIAWYQPN
jgi:hypothetical protein